MTVLVFESPAVTEVKIGFSSIFHGAGFTGSGERDIIKATAKLRKYADGTVFSAKHKDHVAYPFDGLSTFPTAFEKAKVLVKGRLPNNIAEAVSRVAILASGVDKKNARMVRLTFRKDELELYAEKTGGEASETIPWETELEEDPQNTEVWVNTSFLLEASNKVMDFTLCYMDMDPTAPPSLSLVFQSGEFMQFVQGATATK